MSIGHIELCKSLNSPTLDEASVRLFRVVDFPLEGFVTSLVSAEMRAGWIWSSILYQRGQSGDREA